MGRNKLRHTPYIYISIIILQFSFHYIGKDIGKLTKKRGKFKEKEQIFNKILFDFMPGSLYI